MPLNPALLDPALFEGSQPSPVAPSSPVVQLPANLAPDPLQSTPLPSPTKPANQLPNVTNVNFHTTPPESHQSLESESASNSPQHVTKKKRKKKKARTVKNMKKITDKECFSTFIDHGCELDQDQYPLYPNGETTFVRLPNSKVLNFGIIGYTHTVNVIGASKGDWKETRVKCLGVMRCQNDRCSFRGPPPTASNVLAQLILESVLWKFPS